MEWLVIPWLLAIWLWIILCYTANLRPDSTPFICIGIDHGEWLKGQLEVLEEQTVGK